MHARRGAGFLAKAPLQVLGVGPTGAQDLHRGEAIHRRLGRQVDLAHAARAEDLEDLELIENTDADQGVGGLAVVHRASRPPRANAEKILTLLLARVEFVARRARPAGPAGAI